MSKNKLTYKIIKNLEEKLLDPVLVNRLRRLPFYLQMIFFLGILLCVSSLLNAQYFNDKTIFPESDSYYPKNANIFQLFGEYKEYPITFGNIFDIPEVQVVFENKSFPFYLDFGNRGNIVLTTKLSNRVDYSLLDTTYTYNPDGSVRGRICRIVIPSFKVFNKEYINEKAVISDWKIFSSNSFNGLIGLKYLQGKCFTLDCKKKYLVVSMHSILDSLKINNAEIIKLMRVKRHPFGIHFIGKVNGKESIIYFDTGKSRTMINEDIISKDKIVKDKSGSHYAGAIDLSFGKIKLQLEYPRVRKLRRNINSKYPVGIEVGIDVLKYFLLTIDRTGNNNILVIHK